MVYWCFEENDRWCIWIVAGKDEGQLEDEIRIRGIGGSSDGCGPGEEVVWVIRKGRDARRGGHH